MSRVHLVYPHGDRISCPDAIGRKVGAHLRSLGHEVVHHDWDSREDVRPGADDILLGHPHPAPWTVFRRGLEHPGWRRVVMMCPLQPGDLWQCAWLDRVIPHCDHFIAITGRYWFDHLSATPFAHFIPRTEHLDLAVERADFPPLKTAFNSVGRRRFLYIGHTSWYKNTGYLRAIARAMPGTRFGWIGSGMPLPELQAYGRQDFRLEAARALIADHDVMITVGRADANPTTILEAMAWGLVPVCTPQSGYQGQHGIVNVPLDDVPGAVAVLRQLDQAPETQLLDLQRRNWLALDDHFNWRRFGEQVESAIAGKGRTPLGRRGLLTTLRLRAAEFTSPWSPYPPLPQARWLARLIRNRRRPQ